MTSEELNLGTKKPRKVGNCFCGRREDGEWRVGEHTGKAPLPKSSWRESEKLETATGTKLKREKGERRGFKFHKDCKQGERKVCNSVQFDTCRCSGGKGESPGTEWGLGGSRATWRKAVPLLEGHLVETVQATWSQQTPEGNHICWCWGKVIKGEAWCQMCVVIFHNPCSSCYTILITFSGVGWHLPTVSGHQQQQGPASIPGCSQHSAIAHSAVAR